MKFDVPKVVVAVVPTWNWPEMPEKTAPDGPPSTPTTSGLIVIPPLFVAYSVDWSVPLSATHHGLEALRARPQPLTRCGSVTAAAPWTSETSGVTVYEPPGGAAGTGAAATSARLVTAATSTRRRVDLGMIPPSVECQSGPYGAERRPVFAAASSRLS